jgi:putative colanic acid biosynthesis UDP-glucose lipid carrier transferase
MTVCEDSTSHIEQAKKNDQRITRFGAFLRKSSLDELPQFINVLQGRMSIVGPRPHAVAHNEMYRKLIKGYMIRHKVKPGITGWAQVNGRDEVPIIQKVKFDAEYLERKSFIFDLYILWLTVLRVMKSDGVSH